MKTKQTTMITEQEYFAAEDEYINLTDEQVGQLAQKAADAQPALFTFVAAYYDSLEEDESKEFYIHLIYSTWIAYNHKYKLTRKLSIKEIEKMDEEEEKKLIALNNNEDAMLQEAINRTTQHPQAQLIGLLYTQIGDYFGFDEMDENDPESSGYQDAGITSGVINSFINLLEKARQVLYLS
jgi:hypothetical protein